MPVRPQTRATYTVPLPKGAQKLPEILSREEVARLLASVANRKHRAMLMTTYAGGLRVSETVRLRVSDLDSQRMLIRVEQGKGRKDRYTLLSPRLLEELRAYYRVYRPREWLFPRRSAAAPMTTSSAQRIYNASLFVNARTASMRVVRIKGQVDRIATYQTLPAIPTAP